MQIELIAQSALRIESKQKVIYFDPFKIDKNYNDADYIFITHAHFDHFSKEDIMKVKKEDTKIIVPKDLEDKVQDMDYTLVEPYLDYEVDGLKFKTIPSYNLNKDFHKKEYNWVGYIVSIDDQTIYVAGDTDATFEAKAVSCDVACVPIGGTYTMTAKEAADLIKEIKPSIAIPTHYQTIVGSVDDAYTFENELKDICEVKILMK